MKTYQTSGNYAAYQHLRAGLIIESVRRESGVRLPPEHPQYADFCAAFESALDIAEADALCRALLN